MEGNYSLVSFFYFSQEIEKSKYNLTAFEYVFEKTGIKELKERKKFLEANLNLENAQQYNEVLQKYMDLNGYFFEDIIKKDAKELNIKKVLKRKVGKLSGGEKMTFDFNLEKQKGIENIVKITDKDFNIPEKTYEENPIIRFGSRGIITNDKGQIAIIYKEKKNEYKLPGGGIEPNENAAEAFERECQEEIATKINIKTLLGTAEEYKSQENFKQLSFVFVAEKIAAYENVSLTQKEKDEGTKYLWLDKLDALEKMKDSFKNLNGSTYDNLYRTKFMVLRDIKILEYYINNQK